MTTTQPWELMKPWIGRLPKLVDWLGAQGRFSGEERRRSKIKCNKINVGPENSHRSFGCKAFRLYAAGCSHDIPTYQTAGHKNEEGKKGKWSVAKWAAISPLSLLQVSTAVVILAPLINTCSHEIYPIQIIPNFQRWRPQTHHFPRILFSTLFYIIIRQRLLSGCHRAKKVYAIRVCSTMRRNQGEVSLENYYIQTNQDLDSLLRHDVNQLGWHIRNVDTMSFLSKSSRA